MFENSMISIICLCILVSDYLPTLYFCIIVYYVLYTATFTIHLFNFCILFVFRHQPVRSFNKVCNVIYYNLSSFIFMSKTVLFCKYKWALFNVVQYYKTFYQVGFVWGNKDLPMIFCEVLKAGRVILPGPNTLSNFRKT